MTEAGRQTYLNINIDIFIYLYTHFYQYMHAPAYMCTYKGGNFLGNTGKQQKLHGQYWEMTVSVMLINKLNLIS